MKQADSGFSLNDKVILIVFCPNWALVELLASIRLPNSKGRDKIRQQGSLQPFLQAAILSSISKTQTSSTIWRKLPRKTFPNLNPHTQPRTFRSERVLLRFWGSFFSNIQKFSLLSRVTTIRAPSLHTRSSACCLLFRREAACSFTTPWAALSSSRITPAQSRLLTPLPRPPSPLRRRGRLGGSGPPSSGRWSR